MTNNRNNKQDNMVAEPGYPAGVAGPASRPEEKEVAEAVRIGKSQEEGEEEEEEGMETGDEESGERWKLAQGVLRRTGIWWQKMAVEEQEVITRMILKAWEGRRVCQWMKKKEEKRLGAENKAKRLKR